MKTNLFRRIAAAMIAVAGLTVHASTFTVGGSGNSFTITRSGAGIDAAETVRYRTVSLSALAGQHFTDKSGTLTFAPGVTTTNVTVTASTPSNAAYTFQTGTSRNYRFEVTDVAGFMLGATNRAITVGTSVPSSGAFNATNVIVSTAEFINTDDGYAVNAYKFALASTYFAKTAPQAWFQQIGAELRMTLSLDVKEKDDGYQYIQILVDNTSTCDDRSGCSNGNPGNISLSRYMAGFGHNPGSKDTNYATYSFPLAGYGNNCGTINNPWGNSISSKLYDQKFNTGCRSSADGRLILPTDFNRLVVRFNASGDNDDDWYAKNVVARIQAIDTTRPTRLGDPVVAGGRHAYGNTVYISVPFSEIVRVSGTPTLDTTWGTLRYTSGNGSNVLTFKGEITANVGVSLTVNSIGGTIRDLAGNSFNTSTAINKSFSSLTVERPWSGSGSEADPYIITTTAQLDWLAKEVWGGYDGNRNGNTFSGISFKLGADIAYSHNNADTWDTTASFTSNFTAIGGWGHSFQGNFDGDGHSISGIRIYKSGTADEDQCQGLFGMTYRSVIKNLVLYDINIVGRDQVGVIEGNQSYGTIQDCYVYHARAYSTVSSNPRQDIIYGSMDGGSQLRVYYKACMVDSYADVNNMVQLILTEGATVSRTGGTTVNATLTTYSDGISLNGEEYYTLGTDITLGYDGSVPEGSFVKYIATTSSGDITTSNISEGNILTMPDVDVTVSTTFLPVVTYLDADGNARQCDDYTLITSSDSNVILGGEARTHWYVVSGNATINAGLYFIDYTANLILGDGATLTVSRANTHPAVVAHDNLNIFGQTYGNGTLNATVSIDSGLRSSALGIYGGIIHATGGDSGIGVGVRSIITLGYSAPANRITASSYTCGSLTVKAGRTLTDGEGVLYSGTYTGNDAPAALAGMTLQPAYSITMPDDFTVTGTTAHQGYAPAGETVTLHAAEGYSITSASYTPEGGATTAITPVGGVGSFAMPATNITVSATRVANTYTLTYNLAGGSVEAGANPETYTIESGAITLVNPTREHFTFAGWTETDLDEPALTVTIETGSYGDRAYTATWTPNTTEFWGEGDGTPQAPFVITTTLGLDMLATLVNEGNTYANTCFELGADITYTHTSDWNDTNSAENTFTAIGGQDGTVFKGVFDGKGYTISGIRIYSNSSDKPNQGLFGVTESGAVIKNVTLADTRITSSGNYMGGIVGFNQGLVENCHVTGTVCLQGAHVQGYAGGIVGLNASNSAVSGCTSSANLAAGITRNHNDYGGIAGSNSGTVEVCLAIHVINECEIRSGPIVGSGTGTVTFSRYYDCKVAGKANLSDSCTVSAGDNVTVVPAGAAADRTYDYDGIRRYGSNLYFGGTFYVSDNDTVDLTLDVTPPAGFVFEGYTATAGALSGAGSSYTLVMPGVPARTWDADGDGSIMMDPETGDAITTCDDTPYPGVMRYNPDEPNVIYVFEDTDGDDVPDTWIPHSIAWEDIDGDGLLEGGIDRDGDGHIDNVDGDDNTQQVPGGDPDNDPTDGNPNNPTGADAILIHYDSDGDGDVDDDDDWCQLQMDPDTGVITPAREPVSDVVGEVVPADVTINATFSVPYIDADGNRQSCTNYTVIDGSQNSYGAVPQTGWYVVSGNVTVTNLKFIGSDSYLILCDGATLTLNNSSSQKRCLWVDSGNLTLFAQEAGTGRIETESGGSFRPCIYVRDTCTINGGTIDLSSHGGELSVDQHDLIINGGTIAISYYGLSVDRGDLTVNGGTITVTATATSVNGINASKGDITINDGTITVTATNGNGINAIKGDITVNGGRVTVESTSYGMYAASQRIISINGGIVDVTGRGISSMGSVILGYTTIADRITASRYTCGVGDISVTDNQTLTDGTAVYSRTLSWNQSDALAGKTLQPCFSITLPEHVIARGVIRQNGTTAYALPDAAVTLEPAGGYEITSGDTSFTMPAENITVSATVSIATYTLTCNLAGGGVATANPETYTFETPTFTLVNPTREHFTFAGWTGTGLAEPALTVTIGQGSTGDRAYTATWRPNTTEFWGNGDGSQQAPYVITTTLGLDMLATLVNEGNTYEGVSFELGNDIAYAHTSDWDDTSSTENNYTPISGRNGTVFKGAFDGKGYTISGIRIYDTHDIQGLFGMAQNGAVVKNITLADARIVASGSNFNGGIVGYAGGIVDNCHVTSTVNIHNPQLNAGGIVGFVSGIIRGCTSSAKLTRDDQYHFNYGGIAGQNESGTIENCLAINVINECTNHSGPIVGYNHGTVTNSYYRNCTVAGEANLSDVFIVSHATTVTMAPAGDAIAAYDYDGIAVYSYGLAYGGTLYAPEDAEVSLTLGFTGDPNDMSGYMVSAGTLTGGENPYTLTMPDEDVHISAKASIPYIDANGQIAYCTNYTILTGSTEYRSYGEDGVEAWYVVDHDVTYSDGLSFDGPANLILVDGATLTINKGENNDDSGYIFGNQGLSIYAQSGGTGAISGVDSNIGAYALTIHGGQITLVNADTDDCNISSWGDVTINGGQISIENSGYLCIDVSGNLTINGGTLNIVQMGDGVVNDVVNAGGDVVINGGDVTVTNSGYGSGIYGDNVTINGGNVKVHVREDLGYAGLAIRDPWSGLVTLGWSDVTDLILSEGRFGAYYVIVATGQAFTDGEGNYYVGTLTQSQIENLAGKTLTPYTNLGGTFAITYVTNGGTLPSGSPTTYTLAETVTLPVPTKADNTFVGWYEDRTFDGDPVTEITAGTSLGDKTFYAKWKPAKTWVEYLDADGQKQRAHATILYGDETGTLPGGIYTVLEDLQLGSISFDGNTTLILPDGVMVFVYDGILRGTASGDGTSDGDTPSAVQGISVNGDFTVYGQENGDGFLYTSNTQVAGDVAIYGGQVVVAGTLTANNGNGTITLSWTTRHNGVGARTYNGHVVLAKAFVDYNNTIFAAGPVQDTSTINNMMLYPYITEMEVSYLDADGVLRTVTATVLYGGMTAEYPGGVYTVMASGLIKSGGTTGYTRLSFTGDATLILQDGSTLGIDEEGGGGSKAGEAGLFVSGSLTIYGQAQGSGICYATTVQAGGNIAIYGGEVDAGSLTANNGNGTITLGWTAFENCICCYGYVGEVNLARDFMRNDHAIIHAGRVDDLSAINGLELYPYAQTLTINYIDENGETRTADATVLWGRETNLGGGVYTTMYNRDYGHGISFSGDTTLIIPDGVSITVQNNNGDEDDDGITVNGKLSVYGQTQRAGFLTTYVPAYDSYVDDSYAVIRASGDVTIGNVSTDVGNIVSGGDVLIAGGSCYIGGGISSNGGSGTITLGHLMLDDYICCSGYEGTVVVRAGQRFIDKRGNIYSGTLTGEQIAAITGYKILPYITDVAYPTYLEGADEQVKAKYDAWAAQYGADENSAYETAFLLNIAPEVTPAVLHIAGIEVGDGIATVRVVATAGGAAVDLATINGILVVATGDELGALTLKAIPEANITYDNGAAVIVVPEAAGRFIRARIAAAPAESLPLAP